MKKNVGTLDRIIRLIIAALWIVLYVTDVINGILAIILLIDAGILIITSLIQYCPAYLPFKISTIKQKAASK